MKIDTSKLAKVLEALLEDVDVTAGDGACVSASVAIGKIDGKEIQLTVQGDEDEFDGVESRYRCVTREAPHA